AGTHFLLVGVPRWGIFLLSSLRPRVPWFFVRRRASASSLRRFNPLERATQEGIPRLRGGHFVEKLENLLHRIQSLLEFPTGGTGKQNLKRGFVGTFQDQVHGVAIFGAKTLAHDRSPY